MYSLLSQGVTVAVTISVLEIVTEIGEGDNQYHQCLAGTVAHGQSSGIAYCNFRSVLT